MQVDYYMTPLTLWTLCNLSLLKKGIMLQQTNEPTSVWLC